MPKLELPHWVESHWILPKKQVDDFTAKLMDFGWLGNFEKMDLDPEAEARREQSELKVYFADKSDVTSLQIKLKAFETKTIKLKSIKRIPQEDWALSWKKYFKPFFLTQEIVIRPSWETYVPQGAEKVVTLDPGMAFGTGQHDTTKFCAEFICELKKNHPDLKSLLDMGCGSGILALIAKKLGFEKVIGLDTDPIAIETAKENLKRNPDCKEIDFRTGAVTAPLQFDVVVANIIAETLCDLHDDLIEQMSPNGFLILSGIMPERASLVKEKFSDLKLVGEKKSKDWHAYLYHQK